MLLRTRELVHTHVPMAYHTFADIQSVVEFLVCSIMAVLLEYIIRNLRPAHNQQPVYDDSV